MHFKAKKHYKPKYTREAAYGLLLNGDKIALISTPRGIFLPGGGVEEGESHEDCIRREFPEEIGMGVMVGYHYASTTLTDITPSRDYPIDMVGHCYMVVDSGERYEKVEEDHELLWMDLCEARSALKLVHQAWVIEKLLADRPTEILSLYNPHWGQWFNQLKYLLEEVLGDNASGILHVGSTSIPGMMAKPVIDIDIVIADDSNLDIITERLMALGYTHVGDQGIEGREVFKRLPDQADVILDTMPHHLYACHSDSEELLRHLHFRDSLRESSQLRDGYNDLKKKIIDKIGPYDRSAYVEEKEKDESGYFCHFFSKDDPLKQ